MRYQYFLEKLDAVIGTPDEEWNDEIAMLGRIAELALAVNALVQEIHTLATELPTKLASFGDYVDRTNIHKELPKRLFDFLVVNYLAVKSPLGFAILQLIDVVDDQRSPPRSLQCTLVSPRQQRLGRSRDPE